MIKFRNGDLKLVVGFAASMLMLAFFIFDWMKPLENLSYDTLLKLRGSQKFDSKISVVEITEDGIQAFGRWPWPRKYHGILISVLSQSGVQAILYDILFSEPSDSEDDEVLTAALKTSRDVYLPYAFEASEKNNKIIYGKEYKPLPEFSRWAKGEGFINIQPDADGVIRRIPLIIERDGKLYPAIALELVLGEWGVDFNRLKIEKGKWIEIPRPDKGWIRVPIDENYQTLINWYGKWNQTFSHYSFVDIIRSFKQKKAGQTPAIDLDKLKDQIAVVGLTAIGLTDIKPTPLEPVYPGVGVHATVVQNLLQGEFIKPFGKVNNALLIIVVGLFTSLGLLRKRPVSGAVFVVSAVAGYGVFAFVTLKYWGIWISFVYPALAIFLNYGATTIYSQIMLAIERTRLFNLATRDGLTGLFNIRHFKLLLEAEFLESKEKKKPLCVIMSDIDHFKKFNDTYGHQVGDLVIRETAKVFKTSARDLDIPARYGGEELIMLLPNTQLEPAKVVAERIRKNIENHDYRDEKGSYKVTISLGVACLGNDSSMDQLIKRADDALYKAKEGGRNRIETSDNTNTA